MIGFDPGKIKEWANGEWEPAEPQMRLTGFCNDTRLLKEGDVFVAIRTEKRDGHDFLEGAKRAGAAAALTERVVDGVGINQLVTKDPIRGLQRIAKGYRESFKGKTIGITGSCGKTTVKDLIAHLLSGRSAVHATEKNLNNLLGVPLTLLKADSENSEYVVVEAGISVRGEMAQLGEMIQPDWAVFTSIGASHLEGLGSVAGVAEEKGKLTAASRTKVAYMDQSCRPFADTLFSGDRVLVVQDSRLKLPRSYRSKFVEGKTDLEVQGQDGVEVYHFDGIGNALSANVALAVAVCRDQGLSVGEINERLNSWERKGMRGEWRNEGKARVYVDCYNANPLSMRDSLESFLVMSVGAAARLFVVGSMEELGDAAPALHEEFGMTLPTSERDRVILVGGYAADMEKGMRKAGKDLSNTKVYGDVEQASGEVLGFEGDVFLKGSRKYRLERVLAMLTEHGEKAEC